MDTNEWVILSDDGSLDGDENQIFLGKTESKSVLDMNYFCTSPKPSRFSEESRVPTTTELFQDTIQSEPKIGKDPDDVFVEENTEDHVLVPSAAVETDKDAVFSQFFLQLENKFVDMKMDSPKSSPRGLFPPLDDDAGAMKFEDKGGEAIMTSSPRREMVVMEFGKEEEDPSGGFNLWKWSLTGVGAICSFGVAAATILFFGIQQRNKDHKIQFQIYTDDKRIKQVVQQATKLNEAIAATRGIPLSRAHITYGGYYDGL